MIDQDLRGSESARVAQGLSWQALCRTWASMITGADHDFGAESSLADLVTIDHGAFLSRSALQWATYVAFRTEAFPVPLVESSPERADVELRSTYVDATGETVSEADAPRDMVLGSQVFSACIAGDYSMIDALFKTAGKHRPDLRAAVALRTLHAVCSLAMSYTQDPDWASAGAGPFQDTCPACEVSIGRRHAPVCSYGWCRGTGRELLVCAETRHSAGCEPGVWDGGEPGTLEAVRYGAWRRWDFGSGWVSCGAEHDEAVPDVETMRARCRWNPADQLWMKS